MRGWLLYVFLFCGLLRADIDTKSLNAEQLDEEGISRVLEQLGKLLGLPPVSVEDLTTKVEKIGQLSLQREVRIDFMSRENLGRYIKKLFGKEYPVSLARREERMLRAFGFLESGQDLRAIRQRVLNENIAGFYDERPGVKTLFAISSGTSLNVMNQMILAHELRHAVQDQHVDIRDKLIVESDFDDRRLAALSLIEGDAMILMSEYLISSITTTVPGMEDVLVNMRTFDKGTLTQMYTIGPALGEAPLVVQEQLITPYMAGLRVASLIFARSGFKGLNNALHKPPRSMEQVLHPEKYLDDIEEPVEVRLILDADQSLEFEGRLGELLIRVLLEKEINRSDAETAAAGWGGDHYLVVTDGKAHRLLWKTVWDSKKDSAEFAGAMEIYVAKTFIDGSYRLSQTGVEVSFERWGFH